VDKFYGLKQALGDFPNIDRWMAAIGDRPAVKKGLDVCPFA
jgi:glutathione S-transferase